MAETKNPPEEAAPAPVAAKTAPLPAKTKVDQAEVAATTTAANVNGGRGAQPGGRQDPPLI